MKRVLILIASVAAVGCVSTKTYNASRAEAMSLEARLSKADYQNEELRNKNAALTADRNRLAADTTAKGNDLRALNRRYTSLLAEGSAESTRMLRQLEINQSQLDEKERRVVELQRALDERDAALATLQRKITQALLGFQGQGLTIYNKDGKVYVSMEDKLLFKSGSYEIDPLGAKAVKDISAVLASNPEISVMVEGHTDDVPYNKGPNSPQIRNNLDLSAMRATTVASLLLENPMVDPSRVIAAGRGSSLPVIEGKTPEARQANRRTDIILSPRLDELYKLTVK